MAPCLIVFKIVFAGDPNVPPVLEFVLLSGDNEMENPVLERDATEICDMLPQIARQVYLDGHVAEFHRKTTIVQQETKEAAAETAKAKKVRFCIAGSMVVLSLFTLRGFFYCRLQRL